MRISGPDVSAPKALSCSNISRKGTPVTQKTPLAPPPQRRREVVRFEPRTRNLSFGKYIILCPLARLLVLPTPVYGAIIW